MFADGVLLAISSIICLSSQWSSNGDGVMKATLPLVLTALLGLGSGGAVAQIAPGDPAGNQTIPEKDLSRPGASRHGGAQGGSGVDVHEKNLSDKLDASGGRD